MQPVTSWGRLRPVQQQVSRPAFLDEGRAAGTVRAEVNATDVIMCGAMATQPLPHGPNWSVVATRHIALFMSGVRTFADPLPGPAVTSEDVEAHFADPDS